MKKYTSALLAAWLYCSGLSAQDYYREELSNLFDFSRLPAYIGGETGQISSYDVTGGNNDGFSGTYSYIRREGDALVLMDMEGAGVVNRIWTPTPSRDTVQFYFDGEKSPRINMPFVDLFSGNVAPFKAPLCGNEIGGYFCYLPITYAKSLKIVYKGEPIDLKFHQIQYRKLPGTKKVESFSFDMATRCRDLFAKIESVWSGEIPPVDLSDSGIKSRRINKTIKAGEKAILFELKTGGRIVAMEFDNNTGLQHAAGQLMLETHLDGEPAKAIELPFHHFFGYAYGQPAMRSILLGATSAKYYSYLPMPFDRRVGIDVSYRNDGTWQPDIVITGTIYYTEKKRDSAKEGKLYAQYRREIDPEQGKPYLIADVKGRGHYVGTVLIAQGLEDGMTIFWEGDDCSVIDGEMSIHGTGSEDYFNGGWYAVTDRWDRGISLPIHGALTYDLKTSRTGGYRFMLADKINFDSSYHLTIEHGPEGNRIHVDYSSIGLFFSDKPTFQNNLAHIASGLTPPRNNILLAQDMTLRLYWYTKADFGKDIIRFSSKWAEDWVTDIDFEAVPMVQIDLTGLDNGRYKVALVHQHVEKGTPFVVWQRTKPVSDWINTDFGSEGEKQTIDVGEISITDQLKTITLRKRKHGDVEVHIDRFIFTKIE